jgi:hypothetical protein
MEFYSFYKIAIKGTKHCYIGSTINVSSRKSQHKNVCNNVTHHNHNLKLYQVICQNGGWDNIEFTVIDQKELETKEQSLIQEQKYIVQHKANLNMVSASTGSLITLIERKDMTPNDTDENKKKRQRLLTAIWKRSYGKEKYNDWQRNYMRGKQSYAREVNKLFHCLMPAQEVAL